MRPSDFSTLGNFGPFGLEMTCVPIVQAPPSGQCTPVGQAEKARGKPWHPGHWPHVPIPVRCHASHRCKLATRREEWGGGGGGGQKFCCVTGPKVSESFTIAEFLGCL